MGTIHLPAMLPITKKSSSSLLVVEDLESKLAMKVEEMDFYHRLLSWLLFSCHEEKRPFIEAIRKELSDLRKNRFSALLDGVGRLKNETQEEMALTDVHSDLSYLQMYFNHLDSALQGLKSRIHRHFGEFTHVCIW